MEIFHQVSRMVHLTYTANGSKLRKFLTEDIILQLKPYSLLLYVGNEPFIEKVILFRFILI